MSNRNYESHMKRSDLKRLATKVRDRGEWKHDYLHATGAFGRLLVTIARGGTLSSPDVTTVTIHMGGTEVGSYWPLPFTWPRRMLYTPVPPSVAAARSEAIAQLDMEIDGALSIAETRGGALSHAAPRDVVTAIESAGVDVTIH